MGIVTLRLGAGFSPRRQSTSPRSSTNDSHSSGSDGPPAT